MAAAGLGGLGNVTPEQQMQVAQFQLLQQQIQKTCFNKCFQGGKFPEQLGKPDQVCLAKCMDRMMEAYPIVLKGSSEMADNLKSNLDMN